MIQVVRKLKNAGYKAYLAGGAVRDQIRGVIPTDYDIATSAKPEEVLSLFPKAIPIGMAFGVVLLPLGKFSSDGKKQQVEIATFRSDGTYFDGRHPKSVEFSDERHDALRRDFTINGMFFDPLEERIIDYVGGKKDLEARLIRTIGDPELRFNEDHLRIIRAVRFAAQFSFEIDRGTFDMIRKMAGSVRNVSRERIRDELAKIITGPDPVRGLTLMEDSGILGVILPETKRLKDTSLLNHTMACFRYLKHPSLELAMAVLLFKLEDVAQISQICSSLKLSHAQSDKIISLVRDYPIFQNLLEMGEAKLKRFLRLSYIDDLLKLYHADLIVSGESLEAWESISQKIKTFKPADLYPPVLISGNDLIAMGYSPGPLFKKILNDLEDLQLEGKIKTPEEAKALILKDYRETLKIEK